MLRAVQAAKLKALLTASAAAEEAAAPSDGGTSSGAELLNLLALNRLAYQRASAASDAEGRP